MADHSTQSHYQPIQVALHWIVVVGVIVQISIHEAIVRVTQALAAGNTPISADTVLAWAHVCVGSLILLAVLLRLYLRFKYGAARHAPGTPPLQAKLAQVMHWVLYALLLGMVVTGMLTWNGIAPLGDVHFVINVILFLMVVGHAAAAFYGQFVRKDGTLHRMLPRLNNKKNAEDA